LADADRAQQRGDLEVATANLERAQRLAPQSALVYQRLAELRLQQKRPAEAEQMARKALAYATTNTQQATLWRQIAEARRQQGNLSSAQEALSRAGELDAAAASAAAENVP
jgi:tetratricopeptide (TPR) repeat protein